MNTQLCHGETRRERIVGGILGLIREMPVISG